LTDSERRCMPVVILSGGLMAKPRDQGMVRVSLFLRRDQIDALRAQQERVGVVQAEQIRRAIDAALGLKKPSPLRKRTR
jgi:hypothetical protein